MLSERWLFTCQALWFPHLTSTISGSYLQNLSDLTLILQPLQFQVGCADQLVTSEEGSGEPRVSRGLDWAGEGMS